MGSFERRLDKCKWTALEKLAAEGPNWWTDLLSLWVPSGQPAGHCGLRLALRDGYLNFYRSGQSVARVCFGPRRNRQVEARMEIHAKYVWADALVDHYAQLSDRTIACKGVAAHTHYAGLATLKQWIAMAEQRAGEEKRGVDMVVGNNPTVIDLEMTMPVWSGKPSALRVDMAALDVTDGEPHLVLWEAKPLNAGALRSRSEDVDVVKQMGDYKEYLKPLAHRERVGAAYHTTCEGLLRLAVMTRRDIRLDESIHMIANTKHLKVAAEPRLAIFKGVNKALHLVDFSGGWDAHLCKLRKKGIKVAV